MPGDSSVLVAEPAGASATAELDAELISGAGPQGKPLRRERLEIGGAALLEVARVLNAAPGGAEYALCTRNIPSGTQPVSVAAALDVSDRDVRLLGRAKLLDSAGAVIDPALKGQLPATLGQKTMALALAVSIASDQSAVPISAAVGAPAFVRLSDGAAALAGQKVMASSLPVVLASDQSALPIVGDVDHDAVNTLKQVQVAGHASPVDVPPAAVSATGDRVRVHVDRYGAVVIRRRKIRESYTAVFRLAEAAARLDQTFTHVANTNKQWATLHHLASATKEVRLQSCVVWITSAITVAPQGILELRQISAAPATGNPAITPTPHRRGGTAAEAVALYLPTTAGTEANVNSPLGHHIFDEAVTVATVALAHPQGFGRGGIVLYDAALEDVEVLPPSLPVGVLDGWAVTTRLTGATVVRLTVVMKFTEEIP